MMHTDMKPMTPLTFTDVTNLTAHN